MAQTIPASMSAKSNYFVYFFQDFYREVLIQRDAALRSMESEEEAYFGKNNDGQEGAEAAISLVEGIEEEKAAEEAHPNTQPNIETAEQNGPSGEASKVTPLPKESAQKDPPKIDNDYKDQEGQQVSKEIVCDKIQQKFIALFEKFSLHSQYQPGEFASTYFQDFLYAMVAMLDEVFLSFPWHGQRRWRNNLMEKRFFHTQVAGELFFKKVEDLIQSNDSTRSDLAEVYLMILALGFRGKYRGEDDAGQLKWYREQLYVLIHKHSPSLFHPGRDQLIEESYNHTIGFETIRTLPKLKNWVVSFSTIVLVYVLISSFLWYGVVRELNDVIGQIMFQAQSLGLS